MKIILDELERKNTDPEFNPHQTALFTTITMDSPLNYINEGKYRKKIHRDCRWLLNHGYYNFVVNYGNQYGMLAMQELLCMKKSGLQFTLYRGKVTGERRALIRNKLDELLMAGSCDRCFGNYHSVDFMKKVFMQVTVISSEKYLFNSEQKIPVETIRYYKKLELKLSKSYAKA